MVKNIEIYVRKEKFTFDDGKEVVTIKVIQKMDNAVVTLSPSKTSKDLLKFIIGFDSMAYDKDYLVYSSVGGTK